MNNGQDISNKNEEARISHIDICDCFRVTNCGTKIAMGDLVYIPSMGKVVFKFSPIGKDCIDLNDFPSIDI